MKSKVNEDINLKWANVNKCKTIAWGVLEIRRGRKTRSLEATLERSSLRSSIEVRSCAHLRAPARSQDSERKNLEPSHVRARPPALPRAQVGEKNKNRASNLILSHLSLFSRFSLSLSLSFPKNLLHLLFLPFITTVCLCPLLNYVIPSLSTDWFSPLSK